ncbi:hypothetical protein Taro_056302, partial [Colocasia esculenta]|nr:hypothetical protein [Colocasia esculenta]
MNWCPLALRMCADVLQCDLFSGGSVVFVFFPELSLSLSLHQIHAAIFLPPPRLRRPALDQGFGVSCVLKGGGRRGKERRGNDDCGAADVGARQGRERAGGTRIFGPSQKYSSRHLAAHTTLKHKREGQDTHDELQKRNLREELEERERRHFTSKDKGYAEDKDRRKGAGSGQLLLEGVKREADDRLIPRSVDADDSDVEVKSDDDSDDDDEDDAEALMAELEQIRKERAEDKLRKVCISFDAFHKP